MMSRDLKNGTQALTDLSTEYYIRQSEGINRTSYSSKQ